MFLTWRPAFMTSGVKNNTFQINFPFDRSIFHQIFWYFFDIRLHNFKLKSIFSGAKIPIREAVSMCAMNLTQVLSNAVAMMDINLKPISEVVEILTNVDLAKTTVIIIVSISVVVMNVPVDMVSF